MKNNEAHDAGCQCDDCLNRRQLEAFVAMHDVGCQIEPPEAMHDVDCQCDDCRRREVERREAERREIEVFAAIREIHRAGTQEPCAGYRRLSVQRESRTPIEQAVLPEKAGRLSVSAVLMERDAVRDKGLKLAQQKSGIKRTEKATVGNESLRRAVFDLYRRNGAPDLSLPGWGMKKVAVADYLSSRGFGAASTIEKKIGAFIREAKAPK